MSGGESGGGASGGGRGGGGPGMRRWMIAAAAATVLVALLVFQVARRDAGKSPPGTGTEAGREPGAEQVARPGEIQDAPLADEAPSVTGPRQVFVYFAKSDSCAVYPVPRTVEGESATAVLRATLEVLLAGPTADETAQGFRSAFPDTLEILRHRMRFVTEERDPPHEGRRVEIQFMEELPGGLIRVSFSKELNAYDHGADRVCTIIRQVKETVAQFGEWTDVSIAVDGETRGVLQP